MYYWYNSASQKITSPSSVSQIFPLRLKGAAQAKPCTVVPVRMQSQRMVPGTNIPFPPVDPKFKALCKKFQEPNGLPVHLKGGPMDAVLVKITGAGIIIGTMWWATWCYGRLWKR